MDFSSEKIEMRMQRRRSVAGVVALVASVVMHVLIMLLVVSFLPGLDWNTPPPKTAEKYRKIHLQQVTTVAKPVAVRPPRFRPENPELTMELPKEAGRASEGVDEGVIESRLPPGRQLAAESEPVREPASPPVRPAWQPRQEILMIANDVVASPIDVKPRNYRPVVVRVRKAADLVYAATPEEALQDAMQTPGDSAGDLDIERLDLQNPAEGWGGGAGKRGARRAPPAATPLLPTQETTRVVEEPTDRVSPWKHLEKLLKVEMQAYAPLREPFGYCRITIERIGEDKLPTLPKDLLLVQDCSASITEQRMNFCREGLLRCLPLLQPEDRFNVIGFRDQVDRCFPDWVSPTPDALGKATAFIRAMKSEGDTDIFDSLQSFMEEKRQPGRPMIAFVVSDGVPTVGITDSSRIIGQFSRVNRGAVSVFSMGTSGSANTYLLDLLSYRNRGDTYVVTSGRWDIPAHLEARVRSFSRPLLADLAVVFSAAHECEGYPVMPSNLYLDRPLELFCRYPKDLDVLVFQVTGRAGATECDMVFALQVNKATSGDESIRSAWAWQKVYQLISDHIRTQSVTVLRELRQVGNAYGLRVPYKEELATPPSAAP